MACIRLSAASRGVPKKSLHLPVSIVRSTDCTITNKGRIPSTGSQQANLLTRLEIEFLPRLACGNPVTLALLIMKGLYNAASLEQTAQQRPLPVPIDLSCRFL
jgi:hypothetical protein